MAVIGSIFVPIVMIILSSVGLFEPITFTFFGRKFKFGKEKS